MESQVNVLAREHRVDQDIGDAGADAVEQRYRTARATPSSDPYCGILYNL
jgi:hypothetical protein